MPGAACQRPPAGADPSGDDAGLARDGVKPADIKSGRKKLRVSQRDFALMIGVNVSTLRNWEQGRRGPDGPALALLRVASKNPGAVAEALHGWRGAA